MSAGCVRCAVAVFIDAGYTFGPFTPGLNMHLSDVFLLAVLSVIIM